MTKKLQGAGGQHQPFIAHGKDMDELWNKLNDGVLWATYDEVSYYSSLDCMRSDVMGLADTANFSLDIGRDLWVTPSRWNTLIRQYVDAEKLFNWLEGIKDIATYNRGINALDMQPVQRTVVASNARANRRKWGGCMRMLTYRAFPKPTVTLFSRTSYFGYIGGLDMLCAHKLCALACDMLTADGLTLDEIQFRWVLDTAQVHGFKSMAYMFASGQDAFMRVPEKKWPKGKMFRGHKIKALDEYPTWKLIRNWWERIQRQDKEGKPYEEMKYSAEKRIRRRYHAQTGVDQTPFLTTEKAYGVLSTPIEEINLDRMLYKTPESRAITRRKKRQRSEALVKELFADEELMGNVQVLLDKGPPSDPLALVEDDDLEEVV